MSDEPHDRVLPERPEHRPLERFWPYAELSETPSDEELAAIHPELRAALFGRGDTPFTIAIEFDAADAADAATGAGGDHADADLARAEALARDADDYVSIVVDGRRRHRATFQPGDRPLRIRDLYELVGSRPGTDVLIDDRPLPFARELWLPLVWFLIR